MARFLTPTIFLALFLAINPSRAQQPAKKFTNRLARETSPYLLMHAHNPTDWYPWGPEAFEKARKEGKLVFLSIGYSSCYWCHVMERESFNNEEVAKMLNESFVCIKVDREARPDIDNIYMTALQSMRGGSGGWPLSMFLMADGRPIFGGTYWPREDRKVDDETLPGFKTIIKIVRESWKDDPKATQAQAEKLASATTLALERTRFAPFPADQKLVDEVADGLKEEFDPEYGGFGSPSRKFRGTKFPLPCRLSFLLRVGQRTKNQELIGMATLTLDKMALGGIYDQLGGGFHRYSTERTWTVPHFEKMLYDNAQLAETYAQAYQITKKPLYRRVLAETLAYVERDMMSAEGAFYSSQDAETHHEEGRCYVWTPEELAKALPDKADLDLVSRAFGTGQGVNFEGKYHILTLPRNLPYLAKDMKMSDEELQVRFAAVKRKLLDQRNLRDKPFRNEIALTAWSGEMIAGLAAAGQALQEPKYIAVASKAADFVLKHQKTKAGRLLRTYGAAPGQAPKAAVDGYLEDYAFLVHGLLNLHDATGAKKWLDASKELTDTMIEFHGDKKQGGFFFTAHDHEKLFARGKPLIDGAQPSGNSMAVRNLVRLWKKTGEERYAQEADKCYRAFAASLKSYPAGLSALAHSLDMYLELKEAAKAPR